MEAFWNIVLYTRGNKDNEHSYRVKCWPAMHMVFIKVARNVWQEAAQKRERAGGVWQVGKGQCLERPQRG
eukprot:12259026-Heterocapsa_arctica.AAC.1